MNQELIDYIKKAREAGQSDEQIKEDLLRVGWDMVKIDAALSEKLSAQQNNSAQITNPSSTMTPYWIVLIYKIYGLTSVAIITFSGIVAIGLRVVMNNDYNLILSQEAIFLYGNMLVIYTVAFGSMNLYKWVIPLLGILALVQLPLLSLLSIIKFIIFITLFIIACIYRKYFIDFYADKKAYIAYGFFIIGSIFILITSFYPMSANRISEKNSQDSENSEVRSRDARRLADLRKLRIDLELYYAGKYEYPVNLEVLLATKSASDNKLIATELLKDPVTNNYYLYSYRAVDKRGYVISARLESAAGDEIFQDSKQNIELNKYTGAVKSCAPPFYCISFE